MTTAANLGVTSAALGMVECFAAMWTRAVSQRLEAKAVDAEVFHRVAAAIELFGAQRAAEQICSDLAYVFTGILNGGLYPAFYGGISSR